MVLQLEMWLESVVIFFLDVHWHMYQKELFIAFTASPELGRRKQSGEAAASE